MAFTLDDLLDGVRAGRAHLLKHLSGLTDDQWAWKPYPECKSIAETLAHLVSDDRAALYCLETGNEPDYGAAEEQERDPARLRALLDQSFEHLCAVVRRTYAGSPPDAPVSLFGAPMKLGRAIASLSAEDSYHAGQIAYVRMATDPTWDYYRSIYGGE